MHFVGRGRRWQRFNGIGKPWRSSKCILQGAADALEVALNTFGEGVDGMGYIGDIEHVLLVGRHTVYKIW